MADVADSPVRSNGLSQILSKTRNRGKQTRDSASNSLKSTESDLANSGPQLSVDEPTKSHGSSDEDGQSNGLKKLINTGFGSKRRRRRQEKEEEKRAMEEIARGRSVAERGTLENDRENSLSGSGDGGSLTAYDSEPESPLRAPPLSTHPSHIGYLTTSSPLIHSSTVPTASLSETQLDSSIPRTLTFPLQDSALAASGSTPGLVASSTLRAPTEGSQRRSPSPVGRLKEVLRPRRGSSPHTSPERQTGGVGAGVFPKDKNVAVEYKRGSVASRIGSIFPDRQSPQAPVVAPTSSPERQRIGNIQPLETNVSPQTPPHGDYPAPLIVNTPPTPTESRSSRYSIIRDRGISDPVTSNPNIVTSASGNMISHRRTISNSIALGPSKLSNSTPASLTHNSDHSSINLGSGSGQQGGFFSTVFSAAQNAANSLSNSIANTSVAPAGTRARSGTQDFKELKEVENPEVETLAEKTDPENPMEQRELAVKTLGMGDLSLSHLGISENSSDANTPVSSKFPEDSRGRSEIPREDDSLATLSASTIHVGTGDNVDTGSTPHVDDLQSTMRTRSTYEPSMAGERTPPNGSVSEYKPNFHRSSSMRSAIGRRRNRGSSAATGTTIGAAIAAANASVAHPTSQGITPKITGFAVASKKRNRDFHQLFKSVPDDDYLIEDYSCAIQREILAHGRLYVSEGHLCFSSNIFGWVTTLVMSFDEIVSVEKRNTALLFKNGLMISTLHAKHIFASFTSRDSTYDLIVGIWKLGHPSLRSSLNGVRIEETGGGDKTEKYDANGFHGSQSGSESESDGEDGDDIYDEDEEEEDGMSFTQAEGSIAGSDVAEKVANRKPVTSVVTNGSPTEKSKEDGPGTISSDFPGPATHPPTECTDQDTHYSKILADEVIPAPLGKVYNLMFGPSSGTWMRNWMTNEQKCLELTLDEKNPLGQDNKVRSYSYIKPLSGSIVKQTKCLCTENLDFMDLEKAVTVTISTQTPDVPSGNVFSVKTKYCLSWAAANGTRLQVNCAIEWTGKSWLKGPIEKGANDGQIQYAKDIIGALKAAVSSRRGTVAAHTSGKGKKKGRKGLDSKNLSKATDGATDSQPKVEHWGLLEPVRSLFEPVVDIVKPLLTGNILYGLLVGLLVASWFRFGFSGSGNGGSNSDLGVGFFGTHERIAAYEEIWRREEGELWEWLEERVGMDRLREVGQMPIEGKIIEDRLKDEKMDHKEVEAAIRVTEEKLRVLKGVVEKNKSKLKARSGHKKDKPVQRSGLMNDETGDNVQ